MAEVFKSHGKLMITGEYFVLHGAKSLLLPTKFFQDMTVSTFNEEALVLWESYDQNNNKWFSAEFDLPNLSIRGSETKEKIFLKKILDFVAKKKPNIFENNSGINIKTRMDFNRSWGLGSSAILINNLSNYFGLDPFEVSKNVTNSSGADIASTKISKPIIFSINDKKPYYKEVHFNPPFSKNLLFVYLNKKQSSEKEVEKFKKIRIEDDEIRTISDITNQVLRCKKIDDFNDLIEKHESIISSKIKKETVKNSLFKDFNGSIKSLGAWGGDFVLACGHNNLKNYFKNKGFGISYSFNEMLK